MALADLPTTLSGAAREFWRHWSPRILLALAAAALTARVALAGFGVVDALVLLGLLVYWPFQEWLIHVFILHYRPLRIAGREWDFSVPRLHRAHHRDPWRLELIFIPLQVYLYTPLLLAGLLGLSGLPLGAALTGLSAYLLLSLHYEWVHFLVHTRYRPRSRMYERLWRNHRLHHFKNEHYWFGVTMLGGDRVLRTAADVDAVPTSPTARSLGEAPVA